MKLMTSFVFVFFGLGFLPKYEQSNSANQDLVDQVLQKYVTKL